MDCGTVLEESNIVAEIAFLETSSGAAAVSGSLVARNASTYSALDAETAN